MRLDHLLSKEHLASGMRGLHASRGPEPGDRTNDPIPVLTGGTLTSSAPPASLVQVRALGCGTDGRASVAVGTLLGPEGAASPHSSAPVTATPRRLVRVGVVVTVRTDSASNGGPRLTPGVVREESGSPGPPVP